MADPLDISVLYKQIAGLPELTGAYIIPNGASSSRPSVLVATSERDQELDVKREWHTLYTAAKEPLSDGAYVAAAFPSSVEYVAYSLSPSRSRLCAVRKAAAKSGAPPPTFPPFVIDIIDGKGRLTHSVSTAASHGRMFTAGTIGSLSWRADELALVYVAEPTPPTTKGYYEANEKKQLEDSGGSNAAVSVKVVTSDDTRTENYRGRQFDWREEWGEQLAGVSSPRPFILTFDTATARIDAVDGIPDTHTVGSAQWTPDSRGLIVIGWPHNNRKLGIAAYNSRQSAMYYLPVPPRTPQTSADKDKSKERSRRKLNRLLLLTTDDHSPITPRVSGDGKTIVYTTTDKTWMHWAASKLRMIEWHKVEAAVTEEANTRMRNESSTDEMNNNNQQLTALLRDATRTVVDIVERPETVDAFVGLWPPLGTLPVLTWLHDHRHIALHSHWRCRDVLLIIDVPTGAITRLPPPHKYTVDCSLTLLDVHRHHLLLNVSDPITPSAVFMVNIDINGASLTSLAGIGSHQDTMSAVFERVTAPARCVDDRVQRLLDELTFAVIQIAPNDTAAATPSYDDLPFDAILLRPTNTAQLPTLALTPHGGPHASFATAFYFSSAYLAAAGFAILHTNYRGSTGYGQAMLASLPGKCGDQDVRDNIVAVKQIQAQQPQIVHPTKVCVFGGSHGGFLTTHLIGQHPDMFYAATTRNPVTNVAVMTALTDIPDWCYVECGLEYSDTKLPTADTYAALFAASPIAHLHRVRTPLLLLLGLSDRRVPPQQGLDYFRLLKAQGVTCRCLQYPDAQHGLSDKVSQEADVWINSLLWMLERYDVTREPDLRLPTLDTANPSNSSKDTQ